MKTNVRIMNNQTELIIKFQSMISMYLDSIWKDFTTIPSKMKNVVNGTSPEEFSPYTCGTASWDTSEDNMYSVYCNDKKT